ncbi:hypothetical protein E4U02_10705 [Microbacterium paludicola]|uniref:Uncharacterized protein n=1 Tax=Microbacterium paludicola TaxID=300019 RepID=A0A4Y9FVX5_9MICO|nr:hypothetical protein [Microbacterium paludicola]MBF0816882.1 hypothetical protein [Microbacterium paludicola]TFU32403.1 hypothetical protein E4U02_10705 [Microbacterium paludicola]
MTAEIISDKPDAQPRPARYRIPRRLPRPSSGVDVLAAVLALLGIRLLLLGGAGLLPAVLAITVSLYGRNLPSVDPKTLRATAAVATVIAIANVVVIVWQLAQAARWVDALFAAVGTRA